MCYLRYTTGTGCDYIKRMREEETKRPKGRLNLLVPLVSGHQARLRRTRGKKFIRRLDVSEGRGGNSDSRYFRPTLFILDSFISLLSFP